ncbi:hypothetical protein, partial [Actinokineospora sp.]|uniref:hypothetical protein n=1 Tax=Actinokineospora sp. TaxID=1872133 RepID=UPI003D6B0AED
MTVTLALLGYAAAVSLLTPRLLSGAWLYRSPRLAVLLAHAAGWSVVSSVALAGITCVATPGRVRDCVVALAGSSPFAGY